MDRAGITSHITAARAGEILAELVRTPSRNPDDGEARIAHHVGDVLAGLGLAIDIVDVVPGRPNVTARLAGAGRRTLAFNTHLDTVPSGSGWTRDALSGEVIEGRVFGRGAADAKGPLAAFILTIEALVRSGTVLAGDLVLTGVMDEEAGSMGARELCRTFRADGVIVGEPTGLRIGIAHRGSLRPIIAVSGQTAHSSRPETGVNAIYAAAGVVRALESYARTLATRSHPLCGSPTAAVTGINGGVAPNVIPDRCEIILDRRMIPGETESDVIAEIQAVIDAAVTADGAKAWIDGFAPTTGAASEIAADDPFVEMVRRGASEAGIEASLMGMSGACDMTHFRAIGIPTVVFGPGDSKEAHTPDESILIDDVRAAACAYAFMATDFLGIDGAAETVDPSKSVASQR